MFGDHVYTHDILNTLNHIEGCRQRHIEVITAGGPYLYTKTMVECLPIHCITSTVCKLLTVQYQVFL